MRNILIFQFILKTTSSEVHRNREKLDATLTVRLAPVQLSRMFSSWVTNHTEVVAYTQHTLNERQTDTCPSWEVGESSFCHGTVYWWMSLINTGPRFTNDKTARTELKGERSHTCTKPHAVSQTDTCPSQSTMNKFTDLSDNQLRLSKDKAWPWLISQMLASTTQ